jgi:hypothetical protein
MKIDRFDYLRGVHGVAVSVNCSQYGQYVVQLKGKMGWSESLMKNDEWGGTGTLKVFKNYDDALEAGIIRVQELILETLG